MTPSRIKDFHIRGKTVERILTCGHGQIVELPTYLAAHAYVLALTKKMVDCVICAEIEVAQGIIRTAEQEKADLIHVAAYINGEQCKLTGREILLVQVLLDREVASLEQRIALVTAGIQQIRQQYHIAPDQ